MEMISIAARITARVSSWAKVKNSSQHLDFVYVCMNVVILREWDIQSVGMLNRVRRVVCGMSGGVDSAVAAALLQRAGFDVIGVHMDNWDEQDEHGSCRITAENDACDAESACAHLSIPFYKVSFVKEYWNEVFCPMLVDYERGFTPNPDVLCNRFLKFGAFYCLAKDRWDADYIATGHYAQISKSPRTKNVKLRRAIDVTKDQTLFLSSVHQEPLQMTLFPVGHLYKTRVRQIALELDLGNLSKKKDSVGMCFIGDRSFSQFISGYVANRPGKFVDLETDQIIGDHLGVHHWTLGQRCRVAGTNTAYYVASRDPKSQIMYVVGGRDHPALYSQVLYTNEPHWICDVPVYTENEPFLCMFKFQHTEWTIPALLFKKEEGASLWLSIPTRALTPGQQAVFYHNDVCLGSAKIIDIEPLYDKLKDRIWKQDEARKLMPSYVNSKELQSLNFSSS